MKKTIICALVAFLPILIYSQGYEITYESLQSLRDNNNEPIVATALQKTITIGDETSIANAKITISGVTKITSAKIKLKYSSNGQEMEVTSHSLDDTNYIYNLKDALEEAKGIFTIFIDDVKKGTYQFKIVKSNSNNNSKTSQDASTYLGVIANANFVGNNKFLANLTPIITLGKTINFKKKEVYSNWSLDVQPYLGSVIDTKDSVSFIPALMLQGRAGLMLNPYLKLFGKDNGATLIWMPLGFGIKLLPNIKDSNTIVLQHNFRTALIFKYSDEFLLGVQYTHGWHNTTSESSKFFSKTFAGGSTDIDYLTISGQFVIPSSTENKNYLFLEWRGLLSKKSFSAFTNNTILTFGLRKDLSISAATASSTSKGKKLNILF